MTTKYLSIDEASQRTGVGRTTILYRVNNGKFPEPDAIVTHKRTATLGWLPETIEEYNTNKKEN
ncbi:MAG: hypothetical protein HXK09_00030 [Actinomyces bouchesdurhonensis]|uniref:AlpA family phage regulatory protein n=1 Tax=Actinomyces bouchesdurhonensis TaxID=1852361 RepID=A0A929RNP0_9ACTO|nr:hypothetical protein [Actinomyces bouchesdurhonensis]